MNPTVPAQVWMSSACFDPGSWERTGVCLIGCLSPTPNPSWLIKKMLWTVTRRTLKTVMLLSSLGGFWPTSGCRPVEGSKTEQRRLCLFTRDLQLPATASKFLSSSPCLVFLFTWKLCHCLHTAPLPPGWGPYPVLWSRKQTTAESSAKTQPHGKWPRTCHFIAFLVSAV